MSKDRAIMIGLWILTAGLLVRYVPRNKIRQGAVAFLVKQAVTWLFGLIVVEKDLISYPSRFFKKANRTSFSFEYFIFPAFCALFNIHYPENKGILRKAFHYTFFAGIITFGEVLAERYTNIITYKKWTWYYSFISMWLTYYMSHLLYRWFFKYTSYNPEESLNQMPDSIN